MAFAHSLIVFILVVSFGVLAAVIFFWFSKGKLVQDRSKELDSLGSLGWQTTTLLLR